MKSLLLIILSGLLFGCTEKVLTSKDCIRGKYVTKYCGGYIVEILDESKIGRTWKDMRGIHSYKNSVVASIDTSFLKPLDFEKHFEKEAVFYFRYTEGGYAQKQFDLCEPTPFITIISITDNCED
jgi:hypothetical protein